MSTSHKDFARTTAGDLAYPFTFVGTREAIAQFVRTRLMSWTEEWFLNLEYGMPYRESILVKAPNLSIVGAIIKSEVVTVPGVLRIVEYISTFNRTFRTFSAQLTVQTEDGPVTLAIEGDDLQFSVVLLLLQPQGNFF